MSSRWKSGCLREGDKTPSRVLPLGGEGHIASGVAEKCRAPAERKQEDEGATSAPSAREAGRGRTGSRDRSLHGRGRLTRGAPGASGLGARGGVRPGHGGWRAARSRRGRRPAAAAAANGLCRYEVGLDAAGGRLLLALRPGGRRLRLRAHAANFAWTQCPNKSLLGQVAKKGSSSRADLQAEK